MYTIMSQLDKLKAEREEAMLQQNEYAISSGVKSTELVKAPPQGGNQRFGSIFSDSERIEKLINCDYSFVKVYGKENIEAKYS
jgi:hypothetical protein